MRTEHCLLHVLGVTPDSRFKFVHSTGMSLSPSPVAVSDRSKAVKLMLFLFNVIWRGCYMLFLILIAQPAGVHYIRG